MRRGAWVEAGVPIRRPEGLPHERAGMPYRGLKSAPLGPHVSAGGRKLANFSRLKDGCGQDWPPHVALRGMAMQAGARL